jgi:hypothetical protein
LTESTLGSPDEDGYEMKYSVRLAACMITAAILVGAMGSSAVATHGKFSATATLLQATSPSVGASVRMAATTTTTAAASVPRYLITFTQTGLGSGDVTYLAELHLTVTWVCRNNQPFDPPAANKRTVDVSATTTANFQSKNGAIKDASFETSSATLSPPGAFSCPPGLTLTVASLAVTGLFLTNTASGQTISVTILS